ncbi:hypothetical protein [Terrabacter sp. NPDC080008]|uniref:hypothetical protein n=1 Tax=Terrabacter sp. NPDC080008 TaxID=3155176 RepID=UPI00344C5465
MRGVAAAALAVGGSFAASAHLGTAVLAGGAALCLLLFPMDGLVDRLVAFLAMEGAILIVVCLVGPVWPTVYAPRALGAAAILPGAVALVIGRPLRRVSRPVLALDLMVVAAAVATAAQFAAYTSGDRVTRLAAMVRGGTDYLAHFDYLQNVWLHHGFAFVNASGPLVESRADLRATPTGFEAVWSALGVLVNGSSSLPGPYALFDFFSIAQLWLPALLVLTSVWALSRVLRSARVGVAASLPALVFMAAVTAVGPLSSLVVIGFNSFTLGLAVTSIATGFAITTSGTDWRAHGLATWAAADVGAFTYTLLIPALGLLWLIHVQRSRPSWRLRRRDRAYVLATTLLLGCAFAAATLSVWPNGSAIDASGGIQSLPRGLLLASAILGLVVAWLAGTRLPASVRLLAAFSGVVGLMAAGFAVAQILLVGWIHYYAEKVGYVWLMLALLTVAAEAAVGLDLLFRTSTVGRLKPVVVLLACVATAWSFGYVGPGIDRVTPRAEARPGVVTWSEAALLPPAERAQAAAIAAAVWDGFARTDDRLPLLWQAGVATRHNRWMAVLGHRWSNQADDLILTLGQQQGVIDCSPEPLVTWLRAHPRQEVALLASGQDCTRSAQEASRVLEPGQVSVIKPAGGPG